MVYRKNDPCFEQIVSAFGSDILDEFGEIDRKKLAAVIFSDETKRQALNDITHPAIVAVMERFFENHTDESLVFAEVPLLFEAHLESHFDAILVVACEKEKAVTRMMEDRGYSREEAEARYESQMHPDRQIEQATIVIMNDGTIRELYERVVEVVTALEEQYAS
jgi:dephospho-CoA kinase